MRRQRELMRCDWTFWRVKGSEYYRDPELALKSLWEELDSLKIWPKSKWDEHGNSEETKKSRAEKSFVENQKVPRESKIKVEQTKKESGIAYREKDLFGKTEKYSTQKYKVSGPLLDRNPNPKNIAEALSLQPAILCELIVETLRKRPNYSCVKDALPGLVLKFLGIVSRGNPRERFKRKVFRMLTTLEKDLRIKIYKSVNVRVKLLDT